LFDKATELFEGQIRGEKQMKLDFNVGDQAVYPSHGVGTIEEISEREVSGYTLFFYVIKIHSSGAKIMVPTETAEETGLRPVISKAQVENVLKVLKEPSRKAVGTWNRRFRELNNKLNNGDINEVAAVLRDLSGLKNRKNLSFGEKRILEKAKQMLVEEIAASSHEKAEAIETQLNDILFSFSR
jgi:CarD family transcriptional regulator